MTLPEVAGLAEAIRGEVGKAIVGQAETVDHLLVALLAQGHVLLEGPPGTAKTFLAQCFAASLGLDFGRIQFTPDLMPGDILGSNLFNFQTSQFTLTRGPIFCELLLADEINRTPPKTQASLLEAMQERRVTLDGTAHPLPPEFMVVATQNPIESQGVYPLPEAQLDRFLFKLLVEYPSLAEETRIVARFGERVGPPRAADLGIVPVADPARLAAAAAAVKGIAIADSVVDYVVRLVRATRESADIASGASPRAAVLLANAARA
ncbi:MAG: AAA family ATPase, partial [Alphaproteobacteria bacterium]|nr:AAA family ATPase [Alphaproteobacteria bacterium]